MAEEIKVNGLEKKAKDSWLKRAFKEEWPTMGNHLISGAIATAAATGYSAVADNFTDSDAVISGVATAIDMTSYWGTMIPQLIWRDRNRLKDNRGHINRKKVFKKLGEYLGTISIVESIYMVGRFYGQYALQKNGWEPEEASLAIQLGATVAFTFLFPPLRYFTRQLSEGKE